MMRGFSMGRLAAACMVLLVAACGEAQSPSTTTAAPAEAPVETSSTTTVAETTTTTSLPPPPLVQDLLFVSESFRSRLVELVEETQRLRSMSFPNPLAIESVTTQEMSRRLRDRAVQVGAGEVDETLFELLGLLDSDSDWMQTLGEFGARPTPGYYDVVSQKLWLVSTLESPTPLEEMTLVGEIAKALLDQNLGAWERHYRLSRSGGSDSLTAMGALAEADSTLVELLFSDGMTVEDQQRVSEQARARSAQGPALPSFVYSSLRFSSGPAVDYLQRLYQLGGWDLINDAHRTPPDSTEQILVLGVVASEPILLPRPAVSPPAGYREIEDSVWGQWGWETLLASALDADQAASASWGWGGDRYLLFGNGEHLALVLDYVGDTTEDTAEMRQALEEYIRAAMDVGQARAEGAGVEYYAGDYVWLSGGEDGGVLTFIASSDVELGRQLRSYLFG